MVSISCSHRIWKKISDQQIKKILEMYEAYYKKGDTKGIGDIAKSITRVYFRLLLYIEKNFADTEITEDVYKKVHNSIVGVLDSKGKGAGYYLSPCLLQTFSFQVIPLFNTSKKFCPTFFKKLAAGGKVLLLMQQCI
jgi:hypothetical protein